MTLLPFLVVAIGAGLGAWFGRLRRGVAPTVGLAGLVAALVLTVVLPDQAETSLGGEAVAGGPYVRLFVATSCLAGIGFSVLVLTAVDDTERKRPSMLPGGFLLFAAAAALGLSLQGQFASLLAGSGAGLGAFAAIGRVRGAGVAVPSVEAADEAEDEAGGLAFELLRVGAAAGIAVVVTAALAGQADALGGVPFGVGLADVGLAFAVGLRLGVIPLHGVAVLLGERASRGSSALLLAWGPAVFGVVALGAAQAGVVPLGLPLQTERGLIAGAGVLSIVVGGLVAVAQNDVERAVVYSITQDAGFAVLAFAGTDAAVWGPARSWLLIFAVTKTAFLAWAVTLGATFGTRSLAELRGWARRAPLLAVSLALVALATIGLPGMAAFEVRSELLSAVLSFPLRLVIAVASFGGLLVYGRLLLVGLAEPSVLVAAAPGERPRRFIAEPVPPPPAWTRPAAGRSLPSRRQRTSALAVAGGTIAVNRTPLSASMAVALAAVAVVLGVGLFDLRASAGLNPPPPLPAGQAGQPAGPTFQPIPTEPPTATPSVVAPSDSPAPSPAGS